MSDTLTQIEFRPLVIPDDIDAPDAADFREMVRVRNQVYREISGHDDGSVPADELLPNLQPDEYRVLTAWVAVVDGSIVGRVMVELPLENDSKVAFWRIELLREVWGRGIGTAAYALVEQTARDGGRSILQAWAEHPAAPGPRIAPPTGFGEIPEDHAARFFVRNGYALEQVERNSAFDLGGSFETVERLLAEAEAASTDYRLVQWFAPTPPEFVDGYAWMKSRMITDAPAAALEFDEETWDAARRRPARCQVHRCRAHHPGDRGAAHRHGRAVRVQRARHRQGSHRGDVAGGHPGAQRAPRTQARNAGQVRRTPVVARHRPAVPSCAHLQRRGESPHARHQRGDRVRPDRVRRGLEEGAR